NAKDFGREIIPSSLERYRVQPYLFHDYWADVGTIAAYYDSNILMTNPDAPFKFYHPSRPIFTHPRFLPGSLLTDCVAHPRVLAPRLGRPPVYRGRGILARSLLDRRIRRRHPHIRAFWDNGPPLAAPRRRLLRNRSASARARRRTGAGHRARRHAGSRDRR